MKWTVSLALFAASAALLAGCGNKDDEKVVGHYTYGEINSGDVNKNAAGLSAQQYADSTVEFTSDHEFTLKMGGKPSIQGNWRLSGHDITITPTAYNGKSINQIRAQLESKSGQFPKIEDYVDMISQDVHAKLADDDRSVTIFQTVGAKGSVTFKKASG